MTTGADSFCSNSLQREDIKTESDLLILTDIVKEKYPDVNLNYGGIYTGDCCYFDRSKLSLSAICSPILAEWGADAETDFADDIPENGYSAGDYWYSPGGNLGIYGENSGQAVEKVEPSQCTDIEHTIPQNHLVTIGTSSSEDGTRFITSQLPGYNGYATIYEIENNQVVEKLKINGASSSSTDGSPDPVVWEGTFMSRASMNNKGDTLVIGEHNFQGSKTGWSYRAGGSSAPSGCNYYMKSTFGHNGRFLVYKRNSAGNWVKYGNDASGDLVSAKLGEQVAVDDTSSVVFAFESYGRVNSSPPATHHNINSVCNYNSSMGTGTQPRPGLGAGLCAFNLINGTWQKVKVLTSVVTRLSVFNNDCIYNYDDNQNLVKVASLSNGEIHFYTYNISEKTWTTDVNLIDELGVFTGFKLINEKRCIVSYVNTAGDEYETRIYTIDNNEWKIDSSIANESDAKYAISYSKSKDVVAVGQTDSIKLFSKNNNNWILTETKPITENAYTHIGNNLIAGTDNKDIYVNELDCLTFSSDAVVGDDYIDNS